MIFDRLECENGKIVLLVIKLIVMLWMLYVCVAVFCGVLSLNVMLTCVNSYAKLFESMTKIMDIFKK